MFTGLIKEIGRVVDFRKISVGARLTIETPSIAARSEVGDSIDINGVCLTVVLREGATLTFDVSGETLSRTNLARLHTGDRVNVEDSLTSESKLGGHYVLGHVDGLGRILHRKKVGENIIMNIKIPKEQERYLVSKGSIAVDGISLTINEVRGDTFTVNLIPETMRMTTLSEKNAGQSVNIETDILAKYVEKLIRK